MGQPHGLHARSRIVFLLFFFRIVRSILFRFVAACLSLCALPRIPIALIEEVAILVPAAGRDPGVGTAPRPARHHGRLASGGQAMRKTRREKSVQ